VRQAVILMGASGDLKDLASNFRAFSFANEQALTHQLDPSEYLRMTS